MSLFASRAIAYADLGAKEDLSYQEYPVKIWETEKPSGQFLDLIIMSH
jgi:hypothetical protein